MDDALTTAALQLLTTRLRSRLVVDRKCGDEGRSDTVEFTVQLVLLPAASDMIDDTEATGEVVISESTGNFYL